VAPLLRYTNCTVVPTRDGTGRWQSSLRAVR